MFSAVSAVPPLTDHLEAGHDTQELDAEPLLTEACGQEPPVIVRVDSKFVVCTAPQQSEPGMELYRVTRMYVNVSSTLGKERIREMRRKNQGLSLPAQRMATYELRSTSMVQLKDMDPMQGLY